MDLTLRTQPLERWDEIFQMKQKGQHCLQMVESKRNFSNPFLFIPEKSLFTNNEAFLAQDVPFTCKQVLASRTAMAVTHWL